MLVIIYVGWVSVVFASFGRFSLANIGIVLLLSASCLTIWQRKNIKFTPDTFTKPKWQDLLLLILLAGSAVVYFRPHEYVLGGNDAGGYINIGATLARTGEYIVEDEWTSWLSQYPEVTLREQPPQWRTKYLQFVGWYIDDSDSSRTIPQFFPFHPTLLGVAISIGGISLGLLLTPLWSILSLLVVYLLTRRLFDRNIALLASTLLAITAVMIYFARYPTTEPLTLLLVFTGLLSWQTLWDKPRASILWGILGGLAFGASFLTRIDLPIVAIFIYGWLILVWLQKKWNRNWAVFTLTLSLLALQALISSFALNWPYMWNTYGSLFSLLQRQPWLLILVAGGGILAVGLIFIIWRQGWESFANGPIVHIMQASWFRWLLVVGVIGLSAFAYFIRPLIDPPQSYISWPGGTTAWALDSENWVRMGWYITPLGILLTTLGLSWIIRRESLNRLGLFLCVTVITTLQYVFKIFNTPYHIYTMRRYIPIVLPALMIFIAYFLIRLYFIQHSRRWLTQFSAILLTFSLIAGLLYQSRFVLPLRENRNAVTQLQTVADTLATDAILLIIEPSTSTFGDTFGPPLRFIYGHDVATIRTDDEEAAQFLDDLYAYAVNKERPLQLLATDPLPNNLEDQLRLKPNTFIPVSLHRLQSTFFDYPSQMETAYYGLELHDVLFSDQSTEQAEAITVDIGTVDVPYIQSGFYYKEAWGDGITMRWTDGQPTIEIPVDHHDTVQIDVRARIFRPDSVPPSDVTILLDGQPIGTFTPTESWETFTFSGQPDPINGESSIQFAATTFNPAELGVNGDSRDLGFLIDWIEISTEQ